MIYQPILLLTEVTSGCESMRADTKGNVNRSDVDVKVHCVVHLIVKF